MLMRIDDTLNQFVQETEESILEYLREEEDNFSHSDFLSVGLSDDISLPRSKVFGSEKSLETLIDLNEEIAKPDPKANPKQDSKKFLDLS